MATNSETCTYNNDAKENELDIAAKKKCPEENGQQSPEEGNSVNNIDTTPSDDIPEQIKALDDVISEFEETTTKPVAVLNGENQSEDDGYMSLSRKNMGKKDCEEMPESSVSCASLEAPNKSFPELETCGMSNGECLKEDADKLSDNILEQNLIQTTLPKVRTNSSVATNYSSLPCCGAKSGSSLESKLRVGSVNGGRNVLGIDISAVHKAVLRGGVSKLPEPMLNEHPVTIYPGRYSPPSGGKRLSHNHSVEKHKEICHILNPVSSLSSSTSSSGPSSTSSSSGGDPSKVHELSPVTPTSKPITSKQIFINKSMSREPLRNAHHAVTEYDYSDDSLEEQSLSPPNMQTAIAWEINFNDIKPPPPPATRPDISPENVHRNYGTAWEINFENSPRKSKLPKPTLGGAKKKTIPKPARPSKSAYKSEPLLVLNMDGEVGEDDDDEEEESNSSSLEKLNMCMTRQSNMLGKGTFIIRRATKKDHPKVEDLFQLPKLPAPPTPNDTKSSKHKTTAKAVMESPKTKTKCTPKRNDRSPGGTNDKIYRKNEMTNSKPRHSLELAKTQTSSLTSPRDRLSLTFDTSHSNSLNSKKPLKALLDMRSPEEFLKPQRKCVNLQRNDSQRSMDRSPSLERADDASKDHKNYDLFAYKSSSNGIKEYGELRTSASTTPHTDLAPTLEEEEEQLSDISYGCEPLKRIESNISALLRGEISVVRVGDMAGATGGIDTNAAAGVVAVVPAVGGGVVVGGGADSLSFKRPLEFRPGVHKSESAKEMLLSQNAFGPLPPSPPSSNPDTFDYDDLPPLPPTPTDNIIADDVPAKGYVKTTTTAAEIHTHASTDELRAGRELQKRHVTDELPLPPVSFEIPPPAVPPHRGGHSANTMKSWSIDSNYRRRSPKMLGYGSGITTPTTGPPLPPAPYESIGATGPTGGVHSTKRYVSYGTKRSLKQQSPREEQRLQTSCSLPETPIFARGCDIPRTPFRRQTETPVSGSRTAPRSSTSHSINLGNSIIGISGGSAYGTGLCQRQRSINHALASNEMLRLSGVPARGWYPKQRTMRPASTENIDRLSSGRVWDSAAGMGGTGTHSRKPLTLPPNLTPSFLNKSPREALRRVTSLLITKKKNTKERKGRTYEDAPFEPTENPYDLDASTLPPPPKSTARNANDKSQKPKKKNIFKNLWKKTKHFSLDQ